jgi:hypothetical protein
MLAMLQTMRFMLLVPRLQVACCPGWPGPKRR